MLKSTQGKVSKTGTSKGGEWSPPLVWNKKVPNAELDKFKKIIEKKHNLHFNSYWDFHKWSIENYEKFWEEVWKYFDVIASKPYDQVVVKKGDSLIDYDWFPGAAFNFAENLLRIRDDRIALSYIDETGYEETLTYAQMFEEVKLYVAAFRKHGLKVGDRVACYMSNRKEAILTFLAATSIGAIFGAAQPFLAGKASANIIGVMDAKFLIIVDYHKGWGEDISLLDNLPIILEKSPTLEKVIIIATKDETLTSGIPRIRNGYSLKEFLRSGRRADGSVPDLIFEQLPASHPICINFTSGTTGISKGPMHSAVTLLSSLVSIVFHHNLTSEDIFMNPCPAGWVIWDFYIPCLAVGVNLFLYCGVPYHVRDGVNIWDIMAKHKVTSANLVTSVVDRMEKLEIVPSPKSNLEKLKSVFIIGSPVKVNNVRYILSKVQKNAFVASLYGATESFECFSGFDLNLPSYAGEVQAFALGLDIRCVDDDGRPILDKRGDIVIATPTPSLPICLWKDVDKSIMNATYLSQHQGMWCQNDEGWINSKTKGLIVVGRSDDTLKQNSERFGATDVYFAIHGMEEIMDYICVSQNRGDGECRAVLFVMLKDGYEFTPELKEKIASTIYKELWEYCVPEVILSVPDIPQLNIRKYG
ncbi:acetoacetyl-CoA synthetase-like isoform X2 [Stegodyphus dumicola]|uniref:acetoacetyl-CoA synthetase-like isoform X2 n=1 Tax=Stegodyphus dumicola TaxID=202533 RepID=UPI0015AD4B1B|nr:acetoacetyl-CoA synthetase-like isoform X2 [Stegodyphus dumicola]